MCHHIRLRSSLFILFLLGVLLPGGGARAAQPPAVAENDGLVVRVYEMRGLIRLPDTDTWPEEAASDKGPAEDAAGTEEKPSGDPAKPPRHPDDAVEFNGHYYKVFRQDTPWEEARKLCEEAGGCLACIETDEEQQFLAKLKGTGRSKGRVVWLGGFLDDSGQWQWINGATLDSSRVTCKAEGRKCLAYSKDNAFAARPPSGHAPRLAAKRIQGFICEWEPAWSTDGGESGLSSPAGDGDPSPSPPVVRREPRLLFSLRQHAGSVSAVTFSPDGKRLAVCEGFSVALWNTETGKLVRRLARPKFVGPMDDGPEPIRCAAFSPDGKRLVTGDLGGGLCLWDVNTGAGKPIQGHRQPAPPGGLMKSYPGGEVTCVRFSSDGSRVSSCCDGGPDVLTWVVPTGQPAAQLKGTGGGTRHGLAFSSQGDLLAVTARPPHPVELWDVKTSQRLRTMEGLGVFRRVAFSPDGGTLLGYASGGGGIFRWQVETGKLLKRIHPKELSWEVCAEFSPDAKRLVTRTPKWEAIVWDTESGEKLFHLKGPQPQLCCFAFSSDGGRLAMGSGLHRLVRVWELPVSGNQPADDQPRTAVGAGDSKAEEAGSRAGRVEKAADSTNSIHVLRTWKSTSGDYTVRAKFVKAIGGIVHLRLEDGRVVQVPMNRLSDEDREFLKR